MSASPQQKADFVSVIQDWISPMLIGIVGMLIWRDMSELRSDVKLLLSQQSANQVRIERMESDIEMLKGLAFKEDAKTTTYNSSPMKKEDEIDLKLQ